MTARNQAAFTLTELLIALGVGMIVLNAAFVVFINTGKFFKRIEAVGAKAQVAQSFILMTLAKDSAATPISGIFPLQKRQFRRVGVDTITDTGSHFIALVKEVENSAVDKVVIQPVNIIVPMIRN